MVKPYSTVKVTVPFGVTGGREGGGAEGDGGGGEGDGGGGEGDGGGGEGDMHPLHSRTSWSCW